MSIRAALRKNSFLAKSVRLGKQGLKGADRSRVVETGANRVVDSLELDGATQDAYPNKPRWDYVLGIPHRAVPLIGVEIHPARASEVKAVIAKKNAALAILQRELQDGHNVGRWFWVASGNNALAPSTREARLLVSLGIRLVGNVLNLAKDLIA